MPTLWMEILPGPETTRVLVQDGSKRTLLRARLPHAPSDPRAGGLLCEALALWSGRKVCAALIVEGPDAFCATRPWLNTFDTLTRPPRFEIHFVSMVRPAHARRAREHDRQEEPDELGRNRSYRDLRRRIFSECAR